MSEIDKRRTEWYCSTCDGTDLDFEAWVHWDADKQKWVLDDIRDSDPYCATCEDFSRLMEEREI